MQNDQGFAPESQILGDDLTSGPLAPFSTTNFLFDPNLFSESDRAQHGQLNFNDFPKDFLEGLSFQNGAWRAKMGGYVKTDVIRDFRAIDSTDFFDPITIPIGEAQRTNSRFHARQTRLSLDVQRQALDGEAPIRIFVEGDFFGDGNSMRLRHAYGEYRNLILGQTWSTLAHRAALPNTLDLTGDVASVSPRKAQVRWSHKFPNERWSIAAAIEDSPVNVESQFLSFGEARRILPDAIARIRYTEDNMQLQLASVVRRIGYQPTDRETLEFNGSGLNATGFIDLNPKNRMYGGILWGTGIGSYRELPDLAPAALDRGAPLGMVAWYTGLHHSWSKRWFTNVTYSQEDVNNSSLQPTDSVSRIQYLAVNLIHQPTEYLFFGVEGLWGSRANRDGSEQDASRIMASFGFLLP
ncbi:DcaP family trimeric outer membrane transporter [Pirellulaceae bacterium SH449]